MRLSDCDRCGSDRATVRARISPEVFGDGWHLALAFHCFSLYFISFLPTYQLVIKALFRFLICCVR